MNEKVTLESIYKGFWKCRDLEIQMLWTRLTLLGAFMALTYTGYGVLLMKIIDDKSRNWNVFSAGSWDGMFWNDVFRFLDSNGERFKGMV